jgi:hypothetical protein
LKLERFNVVFNFVSFLVSTYIAVRMELLTEGSYTARPMSRMFRLRSEEKRDAGGGRRSWNTFQIARLADSPPHRREERWIYITQPGRISPLLFYCALLCRLYSLIFSFRVGHSSRAEKSVLLELSVERVT